jgi:ferric citrate transport system permease protein
MTTGAWQHRGVPAGLLLITLFASGAAASLATGGRSDVGLSALLEVFSTGPKNLAQSVMFDIRLPRTLVAVFIGINLAMAGLILQAVTRNPLASPSILGVNQGAALGMVLALFFPAMSGSAVGVFAVTGALTAGALTFAIAGGFQGELNSLRLILGGVAVGAFAYALVRFSFTLDDDLSRQVVRWTSGNISDMRWHDVGPLAGLCVTGLIATVLLSHRLNLMALGEASATGLGTDPRITLLFGAVLAAILTGASVAVAGPVAFVGLVVPHMCRLVFGPDHRILAPAAALGGATLMVLADFASKWVIAPFETPVGVIAALIGAPYFLYQTLVAKDLE